MNDFFDRCRTWSFVVYPLTAPEDWIQQLKDMNLSFLVSPLHDRDLKPEHYHVILRFANRKSFEQVTAITSQLHCPVPHRVHDLQAMVRYLCHLDHPDKFRYSTSDIKAYGDTELIKDYRKYLQTQKERNLK